MISKHCSYCKVPDNILWDHLKTNDEIIQWKACGDGTINKKGGTIQLNVKAKELK
jgi:hypothetical protein